MRSTSRRGLPAEFLIATLAVAVCLSSAAAQAQPSQQAQRSQLQTMSEAGGDYRTQVVSYRDLPFRTVIRQRYDFSCGSASLATLLRFQYGLAVDEADVFKGMFSAGDKSKISKVGFSLLDMKRYLATEGMQSDGYRVPLDILAQTSTPAIVVINLGRYKHFVVVKGIADGHVLIGDPATGLKVYQLAAFQKIWDGTLFVIRAGAPRKAGFNSPVEWGMTSYPPLTYAVRGQDHTISEVTRNLPIAFQITPTIQTPIASLGNLR